MFDLQTKSDAEITALPAITAMLDSTELSLSPIANGLQSVSRV